MGCPARCPPNMFDSPASSLLAARTPQANNPQFLAAVQQAQQAASTGAGRGNAPPRGGPIQGMPPNMPGMPGPGMPGYPPNARPQGNMGRGGAPGGRNGGQAGRGQPPVAPEGAAAGLQQQLANAGGPAQQKQMLGELIFPKIQALQPELAGEITGMLLEMENSELINL